ncbi:hypothetical protein OPV22_021988 [Ensete ventricosum]|uniref:Uncharacterized protein n=1 Tax=Ensete ventricosum TaxID=4639 RepID=A0AAV8PDM9_ENSVE|nr:hypothetical protein OPV22_021988 [Ensete ventricosum]
MFRVLLHQQRRVRTAAIDLEIDNATIEMAWNSGQQLHILSHHRSTLRGLHRHQPQNWVFYSSISPLNRVEEEESSCIGMIRCSYDDSKLATSSFHQCVRTNNK